MARFFNLYTTRLDPLAAFQGFLEDEFWQTAFGKRVAKIPLEEQQTSCFLDYMLVWLMEGPAGEIFATYEDWLLAIIRFADDLHSPRSQRGNAECPGAPLGIQTQLNVFQETRSMGLLNWGERSMSEERNASHIDSVSSVDFYLPEDADGMNHPALDRNVFERCRQRALRMEQRESFQDLHKKLK